MSEPSWKKVIDGCDPCFGIEGDPVVLKALKELVRKEPGAFHKVDEQDIKPTVLHYAAGNGLGEVVEWLLNLPKDTMPFGVSHKSNSWGWTPLFHACLYSYGVKAVEVLLKHGANPWETNSSGVSAMSMLYYHRGNQGERAKILPVIWNDIKTKHPPPNDEILKEVFSDVSKDAMAAAKHSGCPKSFEEAKTYLQSSSSSSSSSLKRTSSSSSSKSTSKPRSSSSSSSSNKRASTSSLAGLRRRLSSAEKKVAAAQSKAENAELGESSK